MEICENCYDEVMSVVRVSGMDVCKSCVKELRSDRAESVQSYAVLDDNIDDIGMLPSDNDIINEYAEIASYNNDYY